MQSPKFSSRNTKINYLYICLKLLMYNNKRHFICSQVSNVHISKEKRRSKFFLLISISHNSVTWSEENEFDIKMIKFVKQNLMPLIRDQDNNLFYQNIKRNLYQWLVKIDLSSIRIFFSDFTWGRNLIFMVQYLGIRAKISKIHSTNILCLIFTPYLF